MKPEGNLSKLKKERLTFLKEYVRVVFCLTHLVYVNDMLISITKRVSNKLHADNLAI